MAREERGHGTRRVGRRQALAGMMAAGLFALAGGSVQASPPRPSAAKPKGTPRVTPTATATPTATPTPTSPPPGVFWGTWQPGAPADMNRLAEFERNAGKTVSLVHWYQGWGAGNAAVDSAALARVAAHGAAPLISWEPWDYTKGSNQPEYSLANIAAGRFDSYAQSWALGLKQHGGPVLLRFAHEMNYGRYPWAIGVNGNTATQYVAAWRRLHGIFRAAGATNVQWVWCPGVAWDDRTWFETMFPGDTYVDWVGLDGYCNVLWGGWQSFSQIFSLSYQRLGALSARPVMIAETACAEAGGDKAAWISETLAKLPTAFPRVRAFVWFNEALTVDQADWRIESSRTAQAAFARAISPTTYRSTWR